MDISSNTIHHNICKKLLNINWINKYKLPKNLIEYHIKKYEFISKLNLMINNKDFSAKSTLNLLNPLITYIIKENSLGKMDSLELLNYIYEFSLNKSFPEATTIDFNPNLNGVCELYLRCFKVICESEKLSDKDTFISKYPLIFLTKEEEEDLEHKDEYIRFVKAFNNSYVYEMIKINGEITGFNTLDHICGVHYLAVSVARQIKALGFKVDLGRVSGSAAGHDIGKYGCKKHEMKRVPYLHYYYSDQWFKNHDINYIRHIAVNHSTWDLELENLSLENLVLIYCDFRVKNIRTSNGDEMKIFTLKDSFQVILDKLDNVNEEKINRYKRVYAKLKDFEDFLLSVNVNTDIAYINDNSPLNTEGIEIKNYSLTQGHEVIDSLKYMAINHNINLMYMLRDEFSLEVLLEKARSEKNWKNLREYLRIFEEYSTYLTPQQKIQTMNFLYENLIHPEDDIRNQCAKTLGSLIAIYDEEYRKEVPPSVGSTVNSYKSPKLLDKYINLLLFPSHKIISTHRYWLGYSLSILVNSLFQNSKENLALIYRDILLKYYDSSKYKSSEIYIFLLETCKYIPLNPYEENVEILYTFLISMVNKRNPSLRLCALESSIYIYYGSSLNKNFSNKLIDYIKECTKKSPIYTENLLRYKLCKALNLEEYISIFRNSALNTQEEIQDIFLSNLKTATDWVRKKYQIELLLENLKFKDEAPAMHTALHFCNLLKVSAVESVRNAAGAGILKVMPRLTSSERNEIAVELLRALEMEEHKFTEYIPKYLGEIFLYLSPKELDEIIDDLSYKIKITKTNVKSLILKTIGVTVKFYDSYKRNFKEEEGLFNHRQKKLLGILLNGLGDPNHQVKQSAFGVIGKSIFGSHNLSLPQKNSIFKLLSKKLLNLIIEEKEDELLFLSNSAGLNHIYRFISDYTFFLGDIDLPIPKKVAFFPGTFDPFSLSHKEIAKRIRDLDFEVYLAVDEFSWSKKTLPNLLRRSILNMSIASDLNMFIYPGTFPTNLSNKEDLKSLKNNFKNSEVYIVVGADVIANASSYKASYEEGSILSFSHIIFERNKIKELEEVLKNIKGNVEILSLPNKYTNISSTQIRNYIDENRDISSLVDPLAQQYIYDNGFYQREPLNKSNVKMLTIEVEVLDNLKENQLIDFLTLISKDKDATLYKTLKEFSLKPSARALLLKNSQSNEILGFSLFHWARSSMLYDELNDVKMAKLIRDTSPGRIIILDGFYVKNHDKNKTILPMLLTETLAFCVSHDYEFALFKNSIKELTPNSLEDCLKLYGFTSIEDKGYSNTWIVNMSNPCVITLDLETYLKEPFRSNSKIRNVINESRINLQKALCNLFPSELILPFNINMIHKAMIEKVCEENKVPTTIIEPKSSGDAMCVPYGDILDRYVIPNTVTKSLHTEKYFNPDMKDFKVRESPHYLDLENQIKMLKSFKRPIILVDNILHKGYRLKALDPIFKKEDIKVQKIITGILSGGGKDLMDYHGRLVDSVYFIPRLKMWFNENSLYPFIGGDSLWRGKFPERNLLPSINLILPYTSPVFIRGASVESIYDFSETCIKNSIKILEVLEEEYHSINERNLTLHSLGEVFTIPRSVDHGKHMKYDLNLSPITYLRNDLESLERLKEILRR
ncbi:nicotinate-nicotinamide nucleotide adenylyltransferase [Clostridium hydrogeniformans]|uniref:nicotinate-nicotinamide nucleotide adenylyltransferase n=1 Tax=Clostridium hydrogeniformans TaxID=349933 RepID=UPI0005559C7E|nr:cytidyltransferase [Clostridium hydrogeniformans]